MDISQEAYDFIRAKDEDKQRADALRYDSAARAVEELSRENYNARHKITILKGLLLVSVIANIYVAMIGWGILK